MMRTGHILAGVVPAIALAAGISAAQQPSRPTAGERVDNAVQNIKQGAREVGQTIREQALKARTSIHDMGVTTRVYGRLHWDKALNSSKIDVSVREDGVATISGVVPDAKARAKAVELTADTVGVSQVVDQLSVGTAATPSTTTRETISTPRGTTTIETKTAPRP
jgi:hyperosmotically inducible periplasmic protein